MGTDMTQLSYTRGPQDNPLLAMTIGEAFDTTVRLHARREALVVRHQNLRYSWGELAEVVEDCARGLLALGLLPGDRLHKPAEGRALGHVVPRLEGVGGRRGAFPLHLELEVAARADAHARNSFDVESPLRLGRGEGTQLDIPAAAAAPGQIGQGAQRRAGR